MIHFLLLCGISFVLICAESSIVSPKQLLSALRIRSGSSDAPEGVVQLVVATSVGSPFLDKKKKFIFSSKTTVLELKNAIRDKFPGSPPISLQRLFHGGQPLEDDSEQIGSITGSLKSTSLLLDMMSGSSSYNRSTFGVNDTIEAYLASTTQMAYISDKMRLLAQETSPLTSTAESFPQSDTYRELIDRLRANLQSSFKEQIHAALLREQDPEVNSEEIAAWRKVSKSLKRSSLQSLFVKHFDLSPRVLRSYLYYSVVLAVFAYFGTSSTSTAGASLLLTLIPGLWVSQIRGLRLLSKVATGMAIRCVGLAEFLLPLFSAPWQTLALRWQEEERNDVKSFKAFANGNSMLSKQGKRSRKATRTPNLEN